MLECPEGPRCYLTLTRKSFAPRMCPESTTRIQSHSFHSLSYCHLVYSAHCSNVSPMTEELGKIRSIVSRKYRSKSWVVLQSAESQKMPKQIVKAEDCNALLQE